MEGAMARVRDESCFIKRKIDNTGTVFVREKESVIGEMLMSLWIRTAIAQMEVLSSDPNDNLDVCIAFLHEAVDAGAERVLFPAQCFSDILSSELGRRPSFRADCLRCGYRLLDAAREIDIQVTFGNYTENGDAAVWISHAGGVRVFSLQESAHPWVVVDKVGYALESRVKLVPRGLECAVFFGDLPSHDHGRDLAVMPDATCPTMKVGRVGNTGSGKAGARF
jgi:hypothetical protein